MSNVQRIDQARQARRETIINGGILAVVVAAALATLIAGLHDGGVLPDLNALQITMVSGGTLLISLITWAAYVAIQRKKRRTTPLSEMPRNTQFFVKVHSHYKRGAPASELTDDAWFTPDEKTEILLIEAATGEGREIQAAINDSLKRQGYTGYIGISRPSDAYDEDEDDDDLCQVQ